MNKEEIQKAIKKGKEISKCCKAISRYEKDPGNHHDVCTKCGMECEVYSTKELENISN